MYKYGAISNPSSFKYSGRSFSSSGNPLGSAPYKTVCCIPDTHTHYVNVNIEYAIFDMFTCMNWIFASH